MFRSFHFFLLNNAEPVPPDLQPGSEMASVYGNLVQVIVTLAVMIGIIVLLIKFLARKNNMRPGDRPVRVLGGVALGQHKSMQIVEIGGTLYIVGVGENITLLDKITDAQTVEAVMMSMEGSRAATRPAGAAELSRLFSLWKNRLPKKYESEEPDSAAAFNDLLQAKLNSVANRKETLQRWMDGYDEQRRPTDTK